MISLPRRSINLVNPGKQIAGSHRRVKETPLYARRSHLVEQRSQTVEVVHPKMSFANMGKADILFPKCFAKTGAHKVYVIRFELSLDAGRLLDEPKKL